MQLIAPGELNAYDVLCNDFIVFTRDVLPTFDAKAKRAAAPATEEDTEIEAEIEADEADEAVAPETNDEGAGTPGDAVHPHGAGSHVALRDDAQPEGFPIKGNASSMLYHLPGTSFFGRTIAEVWFATEADAEAAGFARPESQQGDDAPDAGDQRGRRRERAAARSGLLRGARR